MIGRLVIIAAIATMAACATQTSYRPPANHGDRANSKLVARSRDALWSIAVPALGKQFFVINNLDKASGLINLSYTGDPHEYIDCGIISTSLKNATGEHKFSFDGSQRDVTYQISTGMAIIDIHRSLSLEGRLNVIMEEVSPSQTRVSVTTRYVLTRQRLGRVEDPFNPRTIGPETDSIAFNSGGSEAFSPGANGEQTRCVPTGKFESDVLSLIQ